MTEALLRKWPIGDKRIESHAIVELIKANPNYTPYAHEPVTITLFNLAEIYGHALLTSDDSSATALYARFRQCVVEIDDSTLQKAMRFRKTHKKRNLSYADCIGYIYVQRHGMTFLTGDKEFEGMEHVAFVK